MHDELMRLLERIEAAPPGNPPKVNDLINEGEPNDILGSH